MHKYSKFASNNNNKNNESYISLSQKIIAIIVSLALIISLLVSGTYLILNYINNSKATTSNTLTVNTNLYNTDGSMNLNAAYQILSAVGCWEHKNDTGTYTAHNIAGRTNDNSGATITFPMGYYVSKDGVMDTSKPIYWQAVYLSNNYLTIWMNNNYTADYFNSGTSTESGWGNGTLHNSSNYSNYSRSTLRDVTKNIYTALEGKLADFSNLVKSPSEAGAEWQKTEREDVHALSSIRYDHHNNLYYSSKSNYGGDYTDWSHSLWNSEDQPYNDKFWIPSSAEVFNNSSSNFSLDQGLWGLAAADRGFKSTNNSETGSDQTIIEGGKIESYCWLRSGDNNHSSYARQLKSLGSSYGFGVNTRAGVRPAAHISLLVLYELTTMLIEKDSNISNVIVDRDAYFSTTATITATYDNGYYPQFSYNSSTPIKASGSIGEGSLGAVSYNYTFANNIFSITFNNLSTGLDNIPTLNLTAYTLDSFGITVNAPNCVYEIIYEDTQTIINVTPNAGYYVTQAHTNSNASENIKYYRGYLRVTDNAYVISYMASDYSAKVKFIIYDLSGNLTLNIITQNTKPVLEESGGTKIDGVAIQARLSGSGDVLACLGDVRLMGYTTTSGLDYVHISATESKGYRFDYWEIDGTALDISTYGISADVPLDMVLGKVIVAVYTATNNNLNEEINTPDNGGLV